MPDRDNPDGVLGLLIKESVRRDEDFPIRQVREFRKYPTRVRKGLKPAQDLLGTAAELSRRFGSVFLNIF